MHERLKQRYRIRGRLVLETALHLGAGRATSGPSDSPVYRDPAGCPLIPGSSLKGSFRSTVERLAHSLKDVKACGLPGGKPGCIGEDLVSQLKRKWEGKGLDAAARNDKLYELLMGKDPDHKDDHLCDVCFLFGHPYFAGRVFFMDAPLAESGWETLIEVRDGVVIDRDSGRAVDRLKYDYEVIPAGAIFGFSLRLDNPTDKDLGITAVGLRELQEGMLHLGGIKTRGLGRCRLDKELVVESVNFTDPEALGEYLREGKMKKEDEDELSLWIDAVL